MKYVAVILSAIALISALPVVADARPDGRGGRAGGRGEAFFGGGPRRGDPRAAYGRPYGLPYGRNLQYGRPAPPRPYGPPPAYYGGRPPNSLGADWRQQQDEARQGVRQGRYMPLSRVLPELRRRSPGRQLDAGLEQAWDGRPVYRVRWGAANGRRIDYIIDARTGQVISTDGH